MPRIETAEKNALSGNPARKARDERTVTCQRFAATMALKRFARIWTTPILLVLGEGERRFAELERELQPISAKVLTQRLKELEAQGLVWRAERVSTAPKVVEYGLTPRGLAAKPIFDALAAFSHADVARERQG